MVDKVGYVYDEYASLAADELEEYIFEHPSDFGLIDIKKLERSYFMQVEYHGLLFVLKFVDESTFFVDEKQVTKTLSTIYGIPFDKVFVDAGEILYMFTLRGID